LAENPHGKIPHGRPKPRWEDKLKKTSKVMKILIE
jgi:hypothetical protein